jgi:hypothetical protein
MAIYDLYSKRMKRERGETPDVYTYSDVPYKLRVQIIHIWGDAIGDPKRIQDTSGSMMRTYKDIVVTLRREYGIFYLTQQAAYERDPNIELQEYFLLEADIDKVIDVIELSSVAIDTRVRKEGYLHRSYSARFANAAIHEINERFKEHGLGYCYSNGRIIRVDSELIHNEAVKPALVVLRQRGYENAENEFLSAHEHYRAGNYSEALIECCKAFESVMKIICTKRGWTFDATKATAQPLIDICYANGLIPNYWQNHFTGLRQMLTSGIPTPRNKQAGHGAGAAVANDPTAELTSYVLHMTAATILFLTEAEKKLP